MEERETKRCPYCGEEILAVASKCKHCGEWLNTGDNSTERRGMPLWMKIAIGFLFAILCVVGTLAVMNLLPKEEKNEAFVAENQLHDDTLLHDNEVADNENGTLEQFERLMTGCDWKQAQRGNFTYPAFMQYRHYSLDDVSGTGSEMPGEIDAYVWGEAGLYYLPNRGFWSIDDYDGFPEPGLYVTDTDQIATISYRSSKRMGVCSGYTTSGKTFYLKRKVYEGQQSGTVDFLVSVHPKSYHDAVASFTNMVKNW